MESRDLLAVSFVDPNPWQYNYFGEHVVPLPNGNVVITARGDNSGGQSGGAVYLFDGDTGEIISTIRGRDFANIGSGGVIPLANGNFIICSPWYGRIGNGQPLGAVTWGSGETGVSGFVDASNSLVGGALGDMIGGTGSNADASVAALPNGNYVVASPKGYFKAGAVTLGNGLTGTKGVVDATNSLVGAAADLDDLTILSNGNFVVSGQDTATWVSGTEGLTGPLSPQNSLTNLPLTGGSLGERRIVEVGNSNYVVVTSQSVTWGNGTTGITGPLSSSNSLMTQSSPTGSVTVLKNGNYVVSSPLAQVGSLAAAGAVTWANGNTGITGFVGSSNSLVGTHANDHVGSGGVIALDNGNYVVVSPDWDGAADNVGAVTWAGGSGGIQGAVSTLNSRTGSTANDQIGSGGIVQLTNGNYVVSSPAWDSPTASDVGAVSWASGSAATVGAVSAANSLVGRTAFDSIGSSGVTPLASGNYVVASELWDGDAAINEGAATWGNGQSGSTGTVTALNSLIGSTAEDRVGTGVTPLTNGNYLVYSPAWNFNGVSGAGAITWGNGTATTSAVVSTANSLHGTTAGDLSPDFRGNPVRLIPLTNGNYVIGSPSWDNGSLADAGAALWGNGTTGIAGPITTLNSLYGDRSSSRVGVQIAPLVGGNYVVKSDWNTDFSALTWGNGTSGITGLVTSNNSLVGSKSGDNLGGYYAGGQGIVALPNGSFVFASRFTDAGTLADAGVAAWGSGPLVGKIIGQTANHVEGTVASTNLANIVLDEAHERFYAPFVGESIVRVGDYASGFRIPVPMSVALTAGSLAIAEIAATSTSNQMTLARVTVNSVDYYEVDFGTDASISLPSTTPPSTLVNGTLLRIPVSAITGSITFDLGAGNDTLTIDLTNGDAIPAGNITFNGGDPTVAPGDTLGIVGGNQGTVTYNHINAHDGNVVLSNFGTINYTGLEPITNSGTATDIIFNLPAATNSVTFDDDAMAGNGMSRLSGSTFETTIFSNPTGSLTINPGSASDVLVSEALPDFNASLNFGTTANRFSSLRWNGGLSLGTDKSLIGYASGTILLPLATSDLATSGTGAITLTSARNISLSTGASITAVNGDVNLSANLQAPSTSENFRGIDLAGGVVQTTGLGNVVVAGRGGALASGSAAQGVVVSGVTGRITSGGGNVQVTGTGGATASSAGIMVSGGVITAGGSGTVTLQGTGGTSASGTDNHGIVVTSAGLVTSSGGAVLVQGNGGGSGGSNFNYGVYVAIATVSNAGAAGTSSVTVRGFGGNTTGVGNDGVYLNASSVVTSSGGPVLVEGTGGGTGASAANHGVSVQTSSRVTSDGTGASATVTVRGFGAPGVTGANNIGVQLGNSGLITSSGGAVLVEGTGGGTGVSAGNEGINVQGGGVITSAGTGPGSSVTVRGFGGSSNGGSNIGLSVYSGSQITSSGGPVSVQGTGASSATGGLFNIGVSLSGVITSAGTAVGATVTVQGTGGFGTSPSFNYGVELAGTGALITSSGGAISVTGSGGANSIGVKVGSSGQILGNAGTSPVTVVGNALDLSSSVSIDAGANEVIIRSLVSRINLGVADAYGASAALGLSDAELDRIFASVVNIGNTSTGLVSVLGEVTPLNHLVITSSTGFTATQPLTMAADKNLTISVPSTSGTITLTAATADIGTTGMGVLSVTARRNIALSSGSSFTSVDGAITIDANQQSSATSGNFVGVDLNGGSIQSTGAGAVTVRGKGGNDSGGYQFGVVVQSAGTVLAGSGNVTVLGTAGNSSGASNVGMHIIDSASLIKSTSGAVLVEGRGGGTNTLGNSDGVLMEGQSRIASDGTSPAATVTVRGFGGGTTGTGQFNSGVFIWGGHVSAAGGALLVEGTGAANPGLGHAGVWIRQDSSVTNSGTASTATVTVRGFGGIASLGNAVGIYLISNATVSSAGGAILMEGTSSTTAAATNNMDGVYLAGVVTSSSPTAPVTINGYGGGAANGTTSNGVEIIGSLSRITSGGGPITINAVAPPGATASTAPTDLQMDYFGQLLSTNGAPITINANSINMIANSTINGGNAPVYIQPRTSGTRIDLGAADVLTGTPLTLGLSDDEMDRITAGVLNLGNSNTGAINVSAAITHGNHLAITTGAGLTATQPLTMAVDKNLTITALGTTNGTIALSTTAGDLAATGTGSISLTTARNVSVGSGASITTVNGAIAIDANQQASPTSGNFLGVDVNGGLVQATGAGTITVRGKGGSDASGNQHGVVVQGGGDIIGGFATATVIGLGGTNSGFSNYGVRVTGTGSQITSMGSFVSVEGTGGGGGPSGNNHGVRLDASGVITNAGTVSGSAVTVRGFGGNPSGTSQFNYGVQLFTAQISASFGPVFVEGVGSNSSGGGNQGINIQPNSSVSNSGTSLTSTVTVRGFGGNSSGGQGIGVDLNPNGLITSAGGAVLVEGIGGSHASGPFMVGMQLSGVVTSTSPAAPVTISGWGGVLGNGGNNIGVWLNGSLTRITSGGGPVTVNATPGNVAAGSKALLMQNTSQIVGAANGTTVTVNANSIDLASNALMDGGGATLIIQPMTSGTKIDLGGADVLAGSPLVLGLTDSELDRITASTLRIGSAQAGQVTVSADITRPAASNIEVLSGGDILISGGQLNTSGGALLLDPGGVSGVLRPTKSGTDISTGALTIASDLAFILNGAIVDTQHTQLNVVGPVNLTGIGLLLSGTFSPVSLQSFVLINNDGIDPIAGTFNGLPEGSILTNPLGNGKNGVITYVGGDGNDVALQLGNQLPTINALSDLTINEDAALQTVSLSGITAGTGETQALTVTASSSNPTLVSNQNVSYSSPAAIGTLAFSPNANENGTAVITVTVRDAGADGIAGNADDSLNQTTFTVNVAAVNDAPSLVKGADQTVPYNAGPQSVTNWATLISAGPGESTQSVAFSVSGNTNSTLFATPPAVAANGTLTFTSATGEFGTANITLIAQDSGGTANGGVNTSSVQTFTITVNPPPTYQVTTFLPTSTGGILNFSRALDQSELNLYDVMGSPFGPADIVFRGANVGLIKGTAFIDPNLRRITFVATNGRLPADDYTVTLRSAGNGFRDSNGELLDGDSDGTAGGDYLKSFTVAADAPGTVSLRLPNFARGPRQPVNIPANDTSGLPISFSEGEGITTASFELRYNPALLTISGATVAPGLPVGASVTLSTSTPGLAVFQFTSPTPLAAGTTRFIDLQAAVPESSTYRAKQVLDLANIVLNGGAILAVDDDAIHVNAYFGDTSGNGTYSGSDATNLARIVVGIANGLPLFKLLDPIILADVSGNGSLSGTDTTRVQQVAVVIPVAEIPPLPSPAASLILGGPDPKLSIPQDLVATAGSDLTIPVHIDSIVDLTGNGLESGELVIYYDATAFDVERVTLGSLLASQPGWAVASRIDALAGRVFISFTGFSPLEGFFAGELVQLHAKVKADAAAGPSAINLAASARDAAISTQLNEGWLTLIPAPTDAANDRGVDGVVTILPADATARNNRPTAQLVDGKLLVTGTIADDQILIAPLGTNLLRVRAGSHILGTFPTPTAILIDTIRGNDRVYAVSRSTPIWVTDSTGAGKDDASAAGHSPDQSARELALLQVLDDWLVKQAAGSNTAGSQSGRGRRS